MTLSSDSDSNPAFFSANLEKYYIVQVKLGKLAYHESLTFYSLEDCSVKKATKMFVF